VTDSLTSIKVTIANVEKHHAFQTARAAAEAGMLTKFVTSTYYLPHRLPYSLIERLLPADSRNLQRLHNRREEAVDRYAVSLPWLGLSANLIAQLPGIRGRSAASGVKHIKNYLFDNFVAHYHVHGSDIFHGFAGSTAQSFQAAKKYGAITVLDQPIMHLAELQEMQFTEYEKWGIRPPAKPFLYHQEIGRNAIELEVADHVIVGLDFVKRSLVKRGIAPSKISVVPYGADVSGLFRPVTRPMRKSFTILYVGVLSWIKGLPYLLDAFSQVGLADSELVVVGSAAPGWSDYFHKRFTKIPHVRWIQGVPQRELAQLYEQADVFVFPSLVGGVGLVVYEAMATGLPVITSDGDVVIRHEVDGLVADPCDSRALQSAIIRLYQDRSLRESISNNAATRAQAFGWSTYRCRIAETYRQLTKVVP
jgi:glycosyltransferase involved in cell wall biosynthesis